MNTGKKIIERIAKERLGIEKLETRKTVSKTKPMNTTETAPPGSPHPMVLALAKELWSIGYVEKCRVNQVQPTMKFDADDFDRAQHAAWLKIAEYVLQMKRPDDKTETQNSVVLNRSVQRDGVWTANGLAADFRHVYAHPNCNGIHRVQTASGEHYAHESELAWDKPT